MRAGAAAAEAAEAAEATRRPTARRDGGDLGDDRVLQVDARRRARRRAGAGRLPVPEDDGAAEEPHGREHAGRHMTKEEWEEIKAMRARERKEASA